MRTRGTIDSIVPIEHAIRPRLEAIVMPIVGLVPITLVEPSHHHCSVVVVVVVVVVVPNESHPNDHDGHDDLSKHPQLSV